MHSCHICKVTTPVLNQQPEGRAKGLKGLIEASIACVGDQFLARCLAGWKEADRRGERERERSAEQSRVLGQEEVGGGGAGGLID